MDTSPLQAERLLLLEANRAGRSADQALSDSLREVEDLYENAPCGYQSLDDSAWFLRVNRTECDWLGYTRDELIGKLRFPDLSGRGANCSAPPPQIPACGFPAPGSCRRSDAAQRQGSEALTPEPVGSPLQ